MPLMVGFRVNYGNCRSSSVLRGLVGGVDLNCRTIAIETTQSQAVAYLSA